MTATYVGSLTVGECIPVAASAAAALDASLAVVLPRLQARFDALAKLAARLSVTPPSLQGSIQAAGQLLATLQASVNLGLPGVQFQASAVAALLASIEADLGKLNAQASFSAALALQLGQPGVHLYTVTGDASDAGPDLAAVLGSGPPGTNPTDQVAGWLLIASDGGTIQVLEAVLGG